MLQKSLSNRTYKHGSYQSFYVYDSKIRHIHKSSVKDRIIHHLLYKYLYGLWDKTFIYDSYSCRLKKGTHKGVLRLKMFLRKTSNNNTKSCYALKCDIEKFFANVDHKILLEILEEKTKNKEILWLLKEVIGSFSSGSGHLKGIPLGNLTSQIFANIYLNRLDQYIKHTLRIKYYIRYADDFLILSDNKIYLQELTVNIGEFLESRLKLFLNSRKIKIRKYACGIDFLGYVILPYSILPRTKTKSRIIRKLKLKVDGYLLEKTSFGSLSQSLQSYLGYLSHANAFKLANYLKSLFSR